MSEKTERSCWPGGADDTKAAAGVTQAPGAGAETPRLKEKDKEPDKAKVASWLPFGRRKDYRELPCDIYGMTILSVVRDYSYIAKNRHVPRHTLRLYFVLVGLAVSIVVQVSTLVWVNHYVVFPSIRNLQLNYQSYHKLIFDQDGVFSEERWRKYAGAEDLCKAALMDRNFLAVVLALWLARVVYKAKDTIMLAYYAQCLPPVPLQSGEDRMIDVKMVLGEEIHIIVGLTNWTRGLIHLLVTVPKLLLLFYLFQTGLRWLAAADDLNTILIVVVTLEFISNIDELVFKTVLPETSMEYVMTTKMAVGQPATNEDYEIKTMKRNYHVSLLIMLLTIGFAFVYAHFLQQVIPFYTGDINPQTCLTFYGHDRICDPFQTDCFASGQSAHGHRIPGEMTGGIGDLAPSTPAPTLSQFVHHGGQSTAASLPAELPPQPPQPGNTPSDTADLFPHPSSSSSSGGVPASDGLHPPSPSSRSTNAASVTPDNPTGLDKEALAHYGNSAR